LKVSDLRDKKCYVKSKDEVKFIAIFGNNFKKTRLISKYKFISENK